MTELRETIDRAAEHFEAEEAKLYRPDGSKRFGEAEHEERQEELRRAFHGVLHNVEADVNRRIASAEESLIKIEGSDPAESLTPEELQRAGATSWIIREDAEALPIPDLIGRCRATLASGDRVSMFLLSRYAGRRIGAVKLPDPYDRDESGESAGSSPGGAAAEELREVVAEMERKLRPDHERRLSEARSAVEEAREIKNYAYLRWRGAKTSLGLYMNSVYGHVG